MAEETRSYNLGNGADFQLTEFNINLECLYLLQPGCICSFIIFQLVDYIMRTSVFYHLLLAVYRINDLTQI